MRGPSNRLQALRRRLITDGEREFHVLSVDGLPARNSRRLGTFRTLPDALNRARQCAATSVVVREWAVDPSDPALRVHVSTQEWLLLWQRVSIFAQ